MSLEEDKEALNPVRQRKLTPVSSANDASHENFFDLSVDMLCVAGYDGYFKRLNPAWTQTLGFTQAELTARPYMEFVHPDVRQSPKPKSSPRAPKSSTLGIATNAATAHTAGSRGRPCRRDLEI